ncbi:MAG: flagellar motor protein MotA [Sulfuricurvum sp. GWF2_44_89]|uniref:Flagellar motor protein MotA n=1 Tax=Sulfuricurvum kujiense TaxID=148813 RepID=A0A2D3WIR3_9BACT|nr:MULTISPECIES: flagellar motor stator protein MotA [Sulfuricurvum]OHD78976.1 MAG: flagellar motor protein MotA [Sulfuricurvum sp. GWF2_44_89]OHD93042.1 MAG: flagellar motor protein MotA [Sulfuricurvum sp. RIFOXYD12_FULL_44_77]OHD97051.1 MAG: flagellar motor protein MotA [Sulfuricurvum sp. RIFOXYD2_FULL_44_160]DAB38166.1 MAG TPA: flagellar motor protein MotA [Sulfuricurvum kujiense]
MDLTVILGIVGAIASISTGDLLDGGNPLHIIHLASLIVIFPTAMSAAAVATDVEYVKGAFKNLGPIVFKKSSVDLHARIKQIIELSTMARRDGLLSLEAKVAQLDNEFLKQGLSMAVDGNEVDTIVETMELVIEETETYYHGCGHYWLLAGETSPVMGLIGAVLGLILALQKLDNPAEMAKGIAGAFTATVTGIFSSYVLLGPWGRKMIAKSHHIVKEQKLMLEGIVGIVHGDNPRTLEAKLLNFLSPAEEKHSQFN